MKRNKYFAIWLLMYIVVLALNIGFWIWLPFGNSALVLLIYIPVFLFPFIILTIIDWTVFRKKLGKKTVLICEIAFWFFVFALYSVITARVFYQIEEDSTDWFVVVYSDKIYNNSTHYRFPLNTTVEINSEDLNIINRKQLCFRDEWERNSRGQGFTRHKYRFQFNDKIDINHARDEEETCDFVIYEVSPYELTQSDLDIIKTKINEFLSKISAYEDIEKSRLKM